MTDPNSGQFGQPGNGQQNPQSFGPPGQPQYGQPQPQYGQPDYGQPQYGQQGQFPAGQQGGYPQASGGYGSMPAAQYGSAQGPGPTPPKVSLAVKLMFAQVGLLAINAISLFLLKDQLKTALRDTNSSTDIDTLVNTAITVGVIIAIIFGVLYALLALQVAKAKNWARIVTWVLAGLGLLGFLVSLGSTATAFSRVLGIIGALLDLAIIILLAQSNAFFRKRTV